MTMCSIRISGSLIATVQAVLSEREPAVGGRLSPLALRALALAARRSCGLLGDRAEVSHERQRVPLRPGLDDPAALVAVDGDAPHGVALLTGGLHTHHLVFEGALAGPAID